MESGNIYKGTHAGWYSVSDECFYSAPQVTELAATDGASKGKMVAVETGNEVTWEEETNWKFRLSAWREPLREWASLPGCGYPCFIHRTCSATGKYNAKQASASAGVSS